MLVTFDSEALKTVGDAARSDYHRIFKEAGEEIALRELTVLKHSLSRIGETRDQYRLDSFVALGGSGVVFKLQDLLLDVPRALKIARPLDGLERLNQKMLESEIARLQELSHPLRG